MPAVLIAVVAQGQSLAFPVLTGTSSVPILREAGALSIDRVMGLIGLVLVWRIMTTMASRLVLTFVNAFGLSPAG